MPETITKTYELISVKGVKGWIRDSWARRAIVALQQAIAAIVVPTASTANPQMDGTAAPGVSTDYSRADHIHPHDTSKADAATTYTKAQVDALIPSVPSASTANPAMDGTASPGSSTAWARGDHVHPSDTSKQDALTSPQMDAVNSGITAAMVTALTTPEQVTGTTDGNGNLKLFNGTDKHVFAAWGSNNVCVPFVYNNNTYVAVFKTDSAHTSVRSTSVTVNYIAV